MDREENEVNVDTIDGRLHRIILNVLLLAVYSQPVFFLQLAARRARLAASCKKNLALVTPEIVFHNKNSISTQSRFAKKLYILCRLRCKDLNSSLPLHEFVA